MSKGTVQKALEKKEIIMAELESGMSLKITKIIKQSDVNIILWRWFANARSLGYPISGPVLHKEALKIAKKLVLKTGHL